MTECIFEWTRTIISRRYLDSVPAKTDDEKYELIRGIALIAMVSFNCVGDELTLEGSWENLVKIQLMLIKLSRLQDNTVVDEDSLKEGNIHRVLENQPSLQHQMTIPSDSQENSCFINIGTSFVQETGRTGHENEVYVNITVSRQFAENGDLGSLMTCKENIGQLISKPDSSLENVKVTQAASEENVSQKISLDDWDVQKVRKASDNSSSNSTLTKSLSPVKRYEKKKDYEKLAPFKFFCSLCSFKTKRESHFQRHMKLHSRVSELFSCTRCDFTTIRLGHLRRHEMTHSDTKFHCNKCSYSTDHHKFLIRHQRIKHASAKRSEKVTPKEILSCTDCAYTTTRKYLYQRHMQAHARSDSSLLQDKNQYHCQQCAYRTGRKEHFVRHMNSVHDDKRPYLCDHCGKAFKRPDALKQHHITHAGELAIPTPYHCRVCAKKCRSQAQLTQHMVVHSNVRAFLCEICGSSFKTRAVQRKHVMTIHNNPKAFSCSHCSRRFNTQYALRRHTKQHSEEKKQKQIDDQEKNEMDGVLQLLHGEPILIQDIPASEIGDSETTAGITVQVVGFVQPYTGDS